MKIKKTLFFVVILTQLFILTSCNIGLTVLVRERSHKNNKEVTIVSDLSRFKWVPKKFEDVLLKNIKTNLERMDWKVLDYSGPELCLYNHDLLLSYLYDKQSGYVDLASQIGHELGRSLSSFNFDSSFYFIECGNNPGVKTAFDTRFTLYIRTFANDWYSNKDVQYVVDLLLIDNKLNTCIIFISGQARSSKILKEFLNDLKNP